ncbi:TPA: hypothetical protein PMC35_002182 [Vibrio cholerae]|nr:hypothetical protein [Vibrio cholerae]
MFYLDVPNKQYLLHKHESRFENTLGNNNHYIRFISDRFTEILISEPDELLQILKAFYDKIRKDLAENSLFSLLPNKTLNINNVVKNKGNIVQVEFSFDWPQPFINFRNEYFKPLKKNQREIAWEAFNNIQEELLSVLPEGLNWPKNKDALAESKKETRFHAFFKYDKLKISSIKFGGNFNAELTDCFDKCVQVFDYGDFSAKNTTKSAKWDGYSLCKKVAPRICPYCNRNFTPVVVMGGEDSARPELDHFLPKSLFPMFSVSFHNLIPSCHCCNHSKGNYNVVQANTRGELSYKLLHPYLRADDQTRKRLFSASLPTYDIEHLFSYDHQSNLKIIALPAQNTKASNSLNCFRLASMTDNNLQGYYQHHDKEILASLDLIHHYPRAALQEISTLLNVKPQADDIELRLFKQRLIDMVIPRDCKNESLGKFKKDSLEVLLRLWIDSV